MVLLLRQVERQAANVIGSLAVTSCVPAHAGTHDTSHSTESCSHLQIKNEKSSKILLCLTLPGIRALRVQLHVLVIAEGPHTYYWACFFQNNPS